MDNLFAEIKTISIPEKNPIRSKAIMIGIIGIQFISANLYRTSQVLSI